MKKRIIGCNWLGWVGLARLAWVGLVFGSFELRWVEPAPLGLGWAGCSWTGLASPGVGLGSDWVRQPVWAGLGWAGLGWLGLGWRGQAGMGWARLG